MLKNIVINMEVMESMLFFWASVSEKEKVSESYLEELTNREEMKPQYLDGFDAIEARKVLSSITNREILNGGTKRARKFWNNNMWMLEDKEMMNSMIAPIKVLNLQKLIEVINEKSKDFKYETVKIHIIPGTLDIEYVKENNLYFNFFKIFPDWEGNLSIEGKTVEEYFEEAIINMNK